MPDFLTPSTLMSRFVNNLSKDLGHVHSCFKIIILIKTTTKNPSLKSVVLESSVQIKPELLFMQLWLGLTEDSRTIDSGSKPAQSGRG